MFRTKMRYPDAKLLPDLLEYRPDTGQVFWKPRPVSMFKSERDWKIWSTRFAGKEAFCTDRGDGRAVGGLFGQALLAYRVVWALHYGEWPAQEIDHIDGDVRNNRIENLRCVTTGENRKNMPMRRNNRSGRAGVYWSEHVNKWVARINVNGVTKHLGVSADFLEACAMRANAEKALGYHANHGRPQH